MEISIRQGMQDLAITHWWYRGRKEIIRLFLRQFFIQNNGSIPKDSQILEVGCGSGMNLSLLKEFGELDGTETEIETIEYLHKNYPNYRIFQHEIPKNIEKSYDMICLLDVLEHIEDEETAIKWIYQHLNSNGILVLTLPCFSFLWSYHDILAHHKRRYTKKSLKKAIQNHFVIEKWSYFNFFLFTPIALFNFLDHFLDWLLRRSPSQKKDRNYYGQNKWLNSLLYKIMSLEVFLLSYLNFPFGVSLIGIFRKKDQKEF